MCVLYVSFGSKVKPRTFGCVAMRNAVFILGPDCRVNGVQVVLSGFRVRLFCFGQATTLCRYGCMYSLAARVRV